MLSLDIHALAASESRSVCSITGLSLDACNRTLCLGNYGSFTFQVKSLGDHEWNRTQQIGVLSSHPFESDTEMSDIDDDDRETIFSSMDLLSPSGHSDAQTLAMMLQEQLDAINKEIR